MKMDKRHNLVWTVGLSNYPKVFLFIHSDINLLYSHIVGAISDRDKVGV